MNDCKAWPHCRGFSLIELLIAMTVVSILAAIALPAYQGYLQQGRYPDTFATPSNTDFYQFSYSQQDAGDYLLKAIPTTRQQDECGTLTLDQTGYRAANRHDCWGS
ncbi:type IV pilin protein [Aeromonas veronii]|uniref:type IV pilin protein n=1 Tax=Aeromonas veronii TaxID=654 RepID=UPI003D24CCC5